MNETELRIGNNLFDSAGNIGKVVLGLGKFEVASKMGFMPLYDCKPIRLTPEILEKCGFKETTEEWFVDRSFENGHYEYWLEEMILTRNAETFIAKVQHLHQLQNLYFALCGEELNIKL